MKFKYVVIACLVLGALQFFLRVCFPYIEKKHFPQTTRWHKNKFYISHPETLNTLFSGDNYCVFEKSDRGSQCYLGVFKLLYHTEDLAVFDTKRSETRSNLKKFAQLKQQNIEHFIFSLDECLKTKIEECDTWQQGT